MAGKFHAVTTIKYGSREEDGSAEGKYVSKTFQVGDEVTGLSKEDMKSLWNAGALEQRDDAEAEEKSDSQGSSTSTSTPKVTSPKAASPKAPQQ